MSNLKFLAEAGGRRPQGLHVRTSGRRRLQFPTGQKVTSYTPLVHVIFLGGSCSQWAELPELAESQRHLCRHPGRDFDLRFLKTGRARRVEVSRSWDRSVSMRLPLLVFFCLFRWRLSCGPRSIRGTHIGARWRPPGSYDGALSQLGSCGRQRSAAFERSDLGRLRSWRLAWFVSALAAARALPCRSEAGLLLASLPCFGLHAHV